jgi:cation diffusion facilitator CzcD-associated flavoprotein CzcO
MNTDYTERVCVVGAGSSGLAAAKNLLQNGIACDVFEKNDDVGGNWYYGKPGSSVYRSTHLISSKSLTEYTDFPMPAEFPAYPNHWQVHEYLRSYARRFGLYDAITFETGVQRIEPADGGRWDVTLTSGERRRYGAVVICNGHNWDPKFPEFPGSFDGMTLHSCQYKTPEVLRDKRVLVVGAGNSGCDIAVESAQNAASTFLSTRRGYYYNPKFVFGKPSDVVNERFLKLRAPLWLQRLSYGLILKLTTGLPQDYGLPAPDHRFFETHPIVNQTLLYAVGHGDIRHKPDVQELSGDRVHFVDGTEERIDVIIYATGFRITFPFIANEHLNWRNGRPELFLNVFHPQHDTLFVVGLIQPDSGQFGLADYQSQAVAAFLRARRAGSASAEKLRRRRTQGNGLHNRGIRYVDSTRHLLEVEHYSYRAALQRCVRELNR